MNDDVCVNYFDKIRDYNDKILMISKEFRNFDMVPYDQKTPDAIKEYNAINIETYRIAKEYSMAGRIESLIELHKAEIKTKTVQSGQHVQPVQSVTSDQTTTQFQLTPEQLKLTPEQLKLWYHIIDENCRTNTNDKVDFVRTHIYKIQE